MSGAGGAAATAVSGIVFRIGDGAFFLPAAVADKLLPMPTVTRVPGGPPDLVGVALVDGETVPVVAVGDPERVLRARGARDNLPMLLCTHLGERIGLVGLDVIATGRFEASGGEISWGDTDARARPFDLGALVAKLHPL